jgi:hypothetical protein
VPFHALEYACATSRTVSSLNSRCHPHPDPDPLLKTATMSVSYESIPFEQRTHPKTICMLCVPAPLSQSRRVASQEADLPPPHLARTSISDVDGTLSLARQSAKPNMLETLAKLRKECAIAFVGGSDLVKIVGSSRTSPSRPPAQMKSSS